MANTDKKKNNTSSIIRNIFKDSYIKNLKLLEKSKSASKNIKTKKDLQSYIKSLGINTYENFIKKFPEILYTLILIDNKLGITTDDVYKTILTSKNINPIKKLEYIIRNIKNDIENKPGNIFSFLGSYDELMKLRNSFVKNKSIINYKDKYVWANVIVWLLKIYKSKENKSLEDMLEYLINNEQKLSQSKINELYLLLDIWTCSSTNECTSTTNENYKDRKEYFKLYRTKVYFDNPQQAPVVPPSSPV